MDRHGPADPECFLFEIKCPFSLIVLQKCTVCSLSKFGRHRDKFCSIAEWPALPMPSSDFLIFLFFGGGGILPNGATRLQCITRCATVGACQIGRQFGGDRPNRV